MVAPINKLIETCPFDLICYSLDWHPSDHISFFENVANRPLDPSSAITDASRTKVGDTVVFTGPPKTEQKLWPAHCIQESWGSEFHKDLIVSFNFLTKSGLYCTKTIRSILKAKLSTRDSIPILTPIRHFSTTKNWAKQKWRTFWKRLESLIATFVALPLTFVLVSKARTLENSTLIQQISNSSLDRDPFTKGLVKGLTLQNRFTIQIV